MRMRPAATLLKNPGALIVQAENLEAMAVRDSPFVSTRTVHAAALREATALRLAARLQIDDPPRFAAYCRDIDTERRKP